MIVDLRQWYGARSVREQRLLQLMAAIAIPLLVWLLLVVALGNAYDTRAPTPVAGGRPQWPGQGARRARLGRRGETFQPPFRTWRCFSPTVPASAESPPRGVPARRPVRR